MTLGASTSWSFAGNTATVVVTITGATGPVALDYLWDDGAITSHITSASTDSASHAYAVYDYDLEPSVGAFPRTITIVVTDVVTGIGPPTLTLGLPVPRPSLAFAPDAGPAPLASLVTGGNGRTDADPADNYPPGVTDTTYAYSSSDGWSFFDSGPGTVEHIWTLRGAYLTALRITNSLGWAASLLNVPLPVVVSVAGLRQFPRDDFLGGAPRQATDGRSVQSSARQGWVSTYR